MKIVLPPVLLAVLAVFALLGLVLFLDAHTKVYAQHSAQPVQIYGCTFSSRDVRVYEGIQENIKKGIWKKSDAETLDQIAAASNGDGAHVCRVFDPESQKHYVILLYSPYGQGSSSAIIEDRR